MPRTSSCLCGACRKCKSRAYAATWRAANPEKAKANARRWYDKNLRRDPSLPHPNLGTRFFQQPRVPAELEAASDLDIAWAAGLFEGEGSIILERKRGLREYATCRVQVHSTDLDTLERMYGICGGNLPRTPEKTSVASCNVKPIYRWTLNGLAASERFYERVGPWLSSRRHGQFVRALETAKEIRARAIP